MVRWWWFGPAVTADGIDRELHAMKSGGIGGFEVQPTYPLVIDSGTGENAVKNLKFMSPEFLQMLGVAATKAKTLGLRMDLTLGSGWPYGGPMFDQQSDGAKELATETFTAAAGQTTVRPASKTAFAAFAGAGAVIPNRRGGGGGATNANMDLTGFVPIPFEGGVAQLPGNWPGGQVIFFESHAAGLSAVKRPAYGADGPVIDHLSARAVDKFIQLVAEPEIKACGDNPPFAIFCDSLEVAGENWTGDFLTQFQKRRGYDLTPLLPALIGNIGPRTADVRYDFGRTLTDLFNENFNARFTALAKKYHTRFRIQGYGSPAANLSSYGFTDLPEGEAGGDDNWRSFRATRYASSAAHLMGQNLASSETFTWLHQAPFRATPLDMKEEVDQHFLEGINQIDCHGWAYTPNGMPYPGGSFYAAANFNDQNPWYIAMPEISGYMQRVSQMLREGAPANDIALYANDSDTWSAATTRFSSMDAAFKNQSPSLGTILDAGYDADLIDDGMLQSRGKATAGKLVFGDAPYPIVVLNGPQNMPLETLRTLEAFPKSGGTLVWTSPRPPSVHVPGYKATDADQQEAAAILAHLFGEGGPGIIAATPDQFSDRVRQRLAPDFLATATSSTTPLEQIAAIHRHADGAEIYFLANTSNQPQQFQATFRQTGLYAEAWNPLTTRIDPLPIASQTDHTIALSLNLEGYASTFVIFTPRHLSPTQPPAPALASTPAALDLSTGWAVTFASGPGGSGSPVTMDQLASWTTLPGMSNYSGVASYQKKITVPAELAGRPHRPHLRPIRPRPRQRRPR